MLTVWTGLKPREQSQTGVSLEQNRYKKTYGDDGESLAVSYLVKEGYQIIARNFRCRQGEIDIVAKDENYLCFIEVKRRKGTSSGHPLEAISPNKIRHICKAALYYLQSAHLPESTAVRFDVVAIIGEEVSLIRDAFSFHY